MMTVLNRRPRHFIAGLLLVLAFSCTARDGLAAESSKLTAAKWDGTLVTIEVARNQYDYTQPWSQRPRRLKKTGIVYSPSQVLTTADQLFDRTLVRLQKNGRGRWWIGEVVWIDYNANLALLTTTETNFWSDLRPAQFGSGSPADGNLQILRWRDGNLETRRAEFSEFTVRESPTSPINHVMLDATSEIQGAGTGEPIVANSQVLGLVAAQEGRACSAIPASFIQGILSARGKGAFKGLGYFHFYWQPAENPDILASLKLPGEPRGVLVDIVPPRPDHEPQVVKPDDIILSIDGFALDIQGDYEDPEFGHLLLENLATRGKWAGDKIPLRIWREGKELEISYTLPEFAYTNSLVPAATYDKAPEYIITGGLVFQPLTDSFLQSWGTDWKRRAPFRLFHYRNEDVNKERPGLVFLSQVLPDPYNIGYQEQRYLVLDKVNGRAVNYLADLRAALAHPVQGYHVIEFVQSDSLRRMVVKAGEPEGQATARVLKRYGITDAFRIDSSP